MTTKPTYEIIYSHPLISFQSLNTTISRQLSEAELSEKIRDKFSPFSVFRFDNDSDEDYEITFDSATFIIKSHTSGQFDEDELAGFRNVTIKNISATNSANDELKIKIIKRKRIN